MRKNVIQKGLLAARVYGGHRRFCGVAASYWLGWALCPDGGRGGLNRKHRGSRGLGAQRRCARTLTRPRGTDAAA